VCEHQLIQDAIVIAARKPLVGRQVMPTRELNDFGITTIKYYEQTDMTKAAIGMAMVQQNADVVGITPKTLDVPVIWKDFIIYARDLASSQRTGIPLDTTFATDAGRRVAEREEEMIWEGAEGFAGFMGVTGRQTQASAGAWSTPANIYTDILAGIKKLDNEGYGDRSAVVVTPNQKADMRLLFANTGIPVLEKIQELADVYTAYFFADDASALVMAPDSENFELQIAQNVITHPAQLPTGDWFFRVYEAIRPQFKRAKSIVELTGITV
jgi:uncharacterized linocin/CFP29 family protein